MGEMQVPADAYYGAQTARAAENFPISDLRFNRQFIAALGLIKSAAAEVNHKLGLLDDKKKSLIQRSAHTQRLGNASCWATELRCTRHFPKSGDPANLGPWDVKRKQA